MFLYEGTELRKNSVFEFGDFGRAMSPPPKSDFNGNFENVYEGEHFLDEFEKKPKEPKLNLGKSN